MQASVDELTEAIAACDADSFTLSATFNVHEMWKQAEAFSATESFQELVAFFGENHVKMTALKAKMPGVTI